jgi:hypothetical protein
MAATVVYARSRPRIAYVEEWRVLDLFGGCLNSATPYCCQASVSPAKLGSDSQDMWGISAPPSGGDKAMTLKPPQAPASQPSTTASPAWALSASDSRRVTCRMRSGVRGQLAAPWSMDDKCTIQCCNLQRGCVRRSHHPAARPRPRRGGRAAKQAPYYGDNNAD